MGVYVVDSNFFIQAHRASYPLDVATSFWDKVKQLAQQGKIISIDKVKKEIFDHQDELKDWCENNLPADFFKETTEFVTSYAQIVEWANSRSGHYNPTALAEFLGADEADAWLVSFAHADVANRILVTHEKSQPDRKNKVKIPEACAPFEISYVDTIEMLRRLGERF
ncbi:MAG: DUF4411 family protein [Cyclobacteriaceae bacterium]